MIHEMPWPLDLPSGDRVCEEAVGVRVINAYDGEVVGEVTSAWWSHEYGRERKLLQLDLKTTDGLDYTDCWISIEWSPRHRRILTVQLVPRVKFVV